MRKTWKKLAAMAVTASMVICGGAMGVSAATEEEPEKVTVNVAYMPDYASLNGLISAIELGYFDDENIDVQLTEFSDGPTIIQAMESGSIDVGYIGQGAHKLCINGKADIFALAHVSNGDAVIGSKEKGTDTIEGLKGKTIAYSSGTSSEDILTKTLEKGGMTMDDITAMDMDATNIVTAMLSGSVDACATWVPTSPKVLEELGDDGVQLTDNKTFIDDTVSLASWIAMPKYAEEKRDFAFVVDKNITCAQIENGIKEACDYVTDVTLFDVYEGIQLGADKKSMAFSVVFTPDEEEFTTEMVEGFVKKILKNLEKTLDIKLRA